MEKKLSELRVGMEGTVTKIEEDLKSKVAGMGIREGKRVKVDSKQPLKGPLEIIIGSSSTSLSRSITAKLWVEIEEDK